MSAQIAAMYPGRFTIAVDAHGQNNSLRCDSRNRSEEGSFRRLAAKSDSTSAVGSIEQRCRNPVVSFSESFMRMRNGGDLRTWGQWVQFGIEAQRQAEIIEVNERSTKSVVTGNVLGGSLDGANIPDGTRDGQRLTWDATRQRWIG